MNAAIYTKIVKSENFNDQTMSLGFRRFICLAHKVKLNLHIAAMMEIGDTDTHDYVVSFFSTMSEAEYRTYVITH